MESKRILFISPTLSSGGAERQMVTIASLLKQKGYIIEFLCYAKGNFYEYLLRENNIKVHWMILPNYFKRMVSVRSFIRKGGYDVVISFLETPNFLNNLATLGGRKWKVITGERSAKEINFYSIKGKIFAWFQRYSDVLVCNSENAKYMWLKYYPQYEKKIKVIYNTVTLNLNNSEYIPLYNGKLNIVIAASYQYLKNIIGIVKALGTMTEYEKMRIHIDWYGRKEVVKGDSRVYDEAASLIQNSALQDVISLHDETKEIHDRMQEADIVGLFSSVEGLPNVICEAMYLGKPVIMSKVSDFSILVDETNGFLCEWDKLESIKNTLLQASRLSVDQLIKMGNNSKEKAIKLFSVKNVINKWIDVIN